MITPIYNQESRNRDFKDALEGMVQDLEKKLIHIAETETRMGDRYFILVMARQEPPGSGMIKQMVFLWPIEPPEFLATMVFCVDRTRGEITRIRVLPGDWDKYQTMRQTPSTPEVIASKAELGNQWYSTKK